MKRVNNEVGFPVREIAAFAIGFSLAIAIMLVVGSNAPAQPANPPQNQNQPKTQQPPPPPPKPPMTVTPSKIQPMPMPKDTSKKTPPSDTTKKPVIKDTLANTPPKDNKGTKDANTKGDDALAGKGTGKGNDVGSRAGDKSTADGSKAPGSGSAKGAEADKSKPKLVIDPPKTRKNMPSDPGIASSSRGGSIVEVLPQIGSERWERLHRHRWRHDWDWAHRFWGPDYGTGNTFSFQNTYTVENSGNTTQQFDYSRPLASRGTKDPVEQADNGNDSKNSKDAQAAKDKDDAGANASKLFDQARASFKDGDYDKAFEQVNAAIEKRPSDATMHEFKALCLFALGKFKEAAPVLYAVIAAGPGWDADTMNNFYTDEDAYQKQFKALKDYVAKEPDTGYGHFVLAYHYMAQGRKSLAVKELKEVTRTQPDDKLSAELLKVLAT